MMSNVLEFPVRPRHDDTPGNIHFRDLASTVERFIKRAGIQDDDVKTNPFDDYDLSLRLGVDLIDFCDPLWYDPEDDEYFVSNPYGATIMDVANSARKEPWAMLAMLLLEFRALGSSHRSGDLGALIHQVVDRFSSSIAEEALRRLSSTEEAVERERQRLADFGEQTP